MSTMNAVLDNLLRRMTCKEDDKNLDESMSWQAYREAERWADRSDIEELENFAEVSPSKKELEAAYFILGSIGCNTADTRCAQILLERAAIESDKYVLSALLNSIAKLRKPKELPLTPLFLLLYDKRWLVRHSAIQALRRSESESAEECLLALLAVTVDPYDKIYCHSTLNGIGTSKSIPLLTQSLASRKRDVKISAEAAITAIKARVNASGHGHSLP